MRRVFALVGLLTLVGILFFLLRKPLFVQKQPASPESMYMSVGAVPSTVSVFDENITQVSHIEITPDGNYMLVATLSGVIWVYHKVDGVFLRQAKPFFTLSTSQPGFPPEEAGLTGMAFGADFEHSGDIFLTYSFALEKKSFRNRVARITFTHKGRQVVGTNLQQIFEAKTPGTGSHQIQDGVGVLVGGKPHFLFTVGDGFVAKRALDPTEEAGKVMLIGRDGSDPIGARPFADFPKLQTLGIRNAPAMAQHPRTGKIAIGDTGPNNYDRFLYGTLFDPEAADGKKLTFSWDGSEESLQKGAADRYDQDKEMVLKRWAPTETPVNIVFYEHSALSPLADNQQYVLVSLFGRTGETVNKPGKAIQLGILTDGVTNLLQLSSFVERAPHAEGKMGHPLGLAVDPTTKDIYFGDIMESRIYKVTLRAKGGEINE
jgi:hypothetical protein